MKIKLATWNMAHWSHQQFNEEAWRYFAEEIDCDVLLFQEANPNFEILKKDSVIWKEIGGTRPWGSGVYSKKFNIKEVPFENSFPGAVVTTEIEIPDGKKLVVISIYGLFEKLIGDIYSIPNLHRIFSDLTGLLENPETKHQIILGGDLNASLQIDEIQQGNSHRVFFERLREFGLHNCFEGFFADFVQTHRHSRSSKPWQNDYFFISNKLKKSLINCEVIVNEEVEKYSDHNPVVMELEI